MKNLKIEATKYTPEIDLKLNGEMSLRGKSYTENTFEFYTPMMKWFEQYFKASPSHTTLINMEITYFNSSSSKLFFDFFDLLEENITTNIIRINWIYDIENESAKEAGEDFIEDFEELAIVLTTKD